VNLADVRGGAGLGETFAMAGPMMGDFGSFCARRTILVPTLSVVNTASTFVAHTTMLVPTLQPVVVCDPVASRFGSGFKVADNESPVPQCRVFCTYNYYNDISGIGGFSAPYTFSNSAGTTVSVPGVVVPARGLDVHRELFGFEQTFLNGNASVEVRLPVFQTPGNRGIEGGDLGDVTALLKYALLYNRQTGNVLTVGLAVTAPTGPGIDTIDGTIRSTLLQPFVGYLFSGCKFFLQGFESVAVPTDSRDTTLLFSDVGIGYSLYRSGADRLITSVAPTLEVHVTTPLNHEGVGALVSVPDIVSLTGGVYVGLGRHCLLAIGTNVPISGTRPYDIEALAQLNILF
jgi:hypothetical protein